MESVESAKSIVVSYRTGTEPPGTTQEQVNYEIKCTAVFERL